MEKNKTNNLEENMSKILMVFGSETGNTENLAHLIEKRLADAGHSVTVQNAASAKAENLADGYDAVLLGASCWGDDSIELQADFDSFFAQADKMGLSGKKVAAFASGDQSYQYFCGAVDVVEEKAKELGAEIITEGLRIEGDGSGEEVAIGNYVSAVLAGL